MTIHAAKPEDLEDIQALDKQLFEYQITNCNFHDGNANWPYSNKGIAYFQKAIAANEGHCCFLYKENGATIAYMTLWLKPQENMSHRINVTSALLNIIFVAKEHRNKGIGTKMLAYAKNWAKEKGASHFEVMVMTQNDPARRFYEAQNMQNYLTTYEIAL